MVLLLVVLGSNFPLIFRRHQPSYDQIHTPLRMTFQKTYYYSNHNIFFFKSNIKRSPPCVATYRITSFQKGKKIIGQERVSVPFTERHTSHWSLSIDFIVVQIAVSIFSLFRIVTFLNPVIGLEGYIIY